ncbi:MAG: zf-HC2 domain-containing protein [Candidatus Krumholzibacteria bacterium]|nr:zf-HC2 domain-containing protein [Candidatus Krumholzibacteria bacterium]
MECHLFRLLIQRYHDGELEPAERAEYENHRRRCEACRSMDGRLALIAGALDGLPLFEPSSGFDGKVLSQVDMGAYRVSPARRAVRAIGRGWNIVPVPVRNGSLIAALGLFFIAVYKPLLDYMIATIRQGAEAFWTGTIFVRELIDKMEAIWKGAGAVRNYEIVGQTLIRAFHRYVTGMNTVQIAAAIVSLILVAVVLHRMLGAARRKGETHVGIL